ncbi:MAG: glutaredoxin family protein [Pseudomonadota bacterium]
MMRSITVYTRRGCHLCDDLLEALEPLVRGRATLELVDIDDDEVLKARYNDAVPVVVVDDVELCRHFLDHERVLGTIDVAAPSDNTGGEAR